MSCIEQILQLKFAGKNLKLAPLYLKVFIKALYGFRKKTYNEFWYQICLKFLKSSAFLFISKSLEQGLLPFKARFLLLNKHFVRSFRATHASGMSVKRGVGVGLGLGLTKCLVCGLFAQTCVLLSLQTKLLLKIWRN